MRRYAAVQTSIRSDTEFLELTVGAQHLYVMCLADPDLSHCGVFPWKVKHLAQIGRDNEVERVEAAAAELVTAGYLVIDTDTDEAMVRSYIRNDGSIKSRNNGMSVAKAALRVASRGILEVLTFEVRRLWDEHPEWVGFQAEQWERIWKNKGRPWQSFPCGNPFSGADSTPSITPSGTPSGTPSTTPLPTGSGTPSDTGLSTPSVTPSGRGYERGYHKPNNLVTYSPEGGTATSNPLAAREDAPAPSPDESQDERIDRALAAFAAERDTDPGPRADEGQSAPPEATGTTPDEWCTADDPRCRVHANWEREQVPACAQCANVRAWFEERDRQAIAEHRQRIADCSWCDGRGLVETHTPSGKPVSLQCGHDGPPPEVPDDPGHRELTSRQRRRELMDKALGRSPEPHPETAKSTPESLREAS